MRLGRNGKIMKSRKLEMLGRKQTRRKKEERVESRKRGKRKGHLGRVRRRKVRQNKEQM